VSVVVVVVIYKAPSSRAKNGRHVVSLYVKFALSITPCVYIKNVCSQADVCGYNTCTEHVRQYAVSVGTIPVHVRQYAVSVGVIPVPNM
jgi:hypothetical protein